MDDGQFREIKRVLQDQVDEQGRIAHNLHRIANALEGMVLEGRDLGTRERVREVMAREAEAGLT